MTTCSSIRSQFSEYLDGAVSGAEMQVMAAHLDGCGECASEFAKWRGLQLLLASVGPAKPPADLGLRLRVAISQERARTMRGRLDGWQLYWQNSLAPVLARGAAGLASAVILLGALALMVGAVGSPLTVAAKEAVDTAAAASTSTPRFLYTVGGTDSRATFRQPVMVEVDVSKSGRVYNYRIISGPQSPAVHEQLDNFLLMSHFTPALFYGNPVPSQAVLSFSGNPAHRG
ncbi:MAG TPA: zf-HC2 domain-containing protein [Acidobacteriaceae bacterium]|nr:zf-HC2 domain-containing protein [Acidobacteriaceae bacterium]